MSVEDIIDKFYAPPEKIDESNLEGMVTERLNSALTGLFGNLKVFSEDLLPGSDPRFDDGASGTGQRVYKMVLGQFKPPTEKAGELGTEERIMFQKYIAGNIEGRSLGEKIKSINDIASGRYIADSVPISEVLSSLGAIKILQQTIDDFNPATAGFIFEAFLAGLLGGEQVTDLEGGALPIEDAMFFTDPKLHSAGERQPISLKLLNPNTPIEGSLRNLLSFFARPEIAAIANKKGIEYIVAVKRREGELDVYSFTIYPKTFFEWINPKYFNFQWVLEERSTKMTKGKAKSIIRAKNSWEREVRKYSPAFGFVLDKDYEFDYWKLSSVNATVKSFFSFRGRSQVKKIDIMLSREGLRAWDYWKGSGWAPKQRGDSEQEKDPMEIPEELTAEWENTRDPHDQPYKSLYRIMKLRQQAFSDTLSAGSESGMLSFVHVRRYLAARRPVDPQRGIPENIQKMARSNSPNQIIKWAKTLEYARHEKQFTLNSSEVQARGHIYGTIKISKDAIQRSLELYAERLERLVLPIYESLNKLTGDINAFFLENQPGRALKASEEAEKLKKHSDKLVEQEVDISDLG